MINVNGEIGTVVREVANVGKLKRCPFDGGEARVISMQSKPEVWQGICLKCGAHGEPASSIVAARAKWNRRTGGAKDGKGKG